MPRPKFAPSLFAETESDEFAAIAADAIAAGRPEDHERDIVPAPSSAQRRAFKRALNGLNRAYLEGRLDYVAFLHALHDLHRVHDREGFNAIDLERELERHEQRRARGRTWANRLRPRSPERREPFPPVTTRRESVAAGR